MDIILQPHDAEVGDATVGAIDKFIAEALGPDHGVALDDAARSDGTALMDHGAGMDHRLIADHHLGTDHRPRSHHHIPAQGGAGIDARHDIDPGKGHLTRPHQLGGSGQIVGRGAADQHRKIQLGQELFRGHQLGIHHNAQITGPGLLQGLHAADIDILTMLLKAELLRQLGEFHKKGAP